MKQRTKEVYNKFDYGTAFNLGDYGIAANLGEGGEASNEGDSGVAVNSGEAGAASNKSIEGVAANFGLNGTVRGCLGSWIICDEWGLVAGDTFHRIDVKVVKVDGAKIKADTWYQLENGEFVEVFRDDDERRLPPIR